MAIQIDTISGKTVVSDGIGGLAIDYTEYYERIATALETIAANSTTIAQQATTIAENSTIIKDKAIGDGIHWRRPHEWAGGRAEYRSTTTRENDTSTVVMENGIS